MTTARQLIVMRHAKAGDLPGGPDAERALRPRGCREATAAGTWLAGQDLVPEIVLCSPARRARQTWQYVSAELPGHSAAGVDVRTDARLYQADAAELLALIGEIPARTATVMYVGHNPAAAELAALLTGRDVPFPTAALAVIASAAPWDELVAGDADLVAVWAPPAD